MRRLLAIAACLATAACGTTHGGSYVSRFQPALGPPPITAEDSTPAQRLALATAALGVASPPETLAAVTTADRLSVAIYYMGESDTGCMAYLDQLGTSQRTWRSTLAILGNLFGIAGGVATPERSKSLLSALSGGMVGVRGNLDEGILSNQASHLIRAGNISLRRRLREEILTSIREGDLSTVGLPVIVQTIQGTYHTRCGIDDALGELARQVGTQDDDDATDDDDAGDDDGDDDGDDGGDAG